MSLTLRIILFGYATTLIAILALHNPFLGYGNTANPSIEGDERRFDMSISGCGGESWKIWEYHHNRTQFLSRVSVLAQVEGETKANAEVDQMRALDTPELRRHASQLNDNCVTKRHYFHPGAQKSFFEWQSVGAVTPALSTGLQLTVVVAATTLVALLAALLFGRSAAREA